MARVLISKATLADFGVPRGNVPVRTPQDFEDLNDEERQFLMSQFGGQTYLDQFGVPLPSEELRAREDLRALYRQAGQPTAEDIERVVRESNVALTPREFANKVPLIERRVRGSGERAGRAGTDFGSKMGLEGSLAHGVAARDFPQILDAEDPTSVPFIRDYYSRQTTIPEHLWDYHTEGPYYDEQGNILPGQVPPVNAVKVMGRDDIASLGTREGYGLKPVPYSSINMDWEEDIKAEHRFPSSNIGFIGNLSAEDLERNSAGNAPAGGRISSGVVGVRGFGRPQDKAFARGRLNEGVEGGFTAPIPPERLVGVMPSTRLSRIDVEDFGALQDLYTKDIPFEVKLQQLVSEGQVSPMDAIHALIRQKTMQNERMTGFGRAQEAATKAALGKPYLRGYYPVRRDDLQGSDAGNYLMQREISDRGTPYMTSNPSPGMEALFETNEAFRDALPLSWQEGMFGFENPLLTEEEKMQYLQDIKDAGWRRQEYGTEDDIDEMEPEELRSLYPRQAGVRFQ